MKKESKIGENEIEIILNVIRETIFKTLQLDSDEAIACVSMGTGEGKTILDYVFPSVRINKDYFNKTIRKDFCDRLRDEGVKHKLPEFKGDWEELILMITEFFSCVWL